MTGMSALPSVAPAIAALDRLIDATRRGAPDTEIVRLREVYDFWERRVCTQVDALERLAGVNR